MKRYFVVLAIIVASLLAAGCVTPTPNMLHSEQVEGQVVPEPGKALVIFMRPREAAFPIHASVHDGDQFVGIVPYNQKLPYQAEPGAHTFMVISEAADFMTADLVAGKTYYAQVVPRMGAWRARFSLWAISREDLDTAEVKQWIEEGQFVTNKASAYEWEEKTRGSIMFKKEAYYPKWLTKSDDLRPHLKAEDGIGDGIYEQQVNKQVVVVKPVTGSDIVTGTYVSDITTSNSSRFNRRYHNMVLILEQKGNTITGTDRSGISQIQGIRNGDTITFDFAHPQIYWGYFLSGVWELNADGIRLQGSWNSHDLSIHGTWHLERVK